ncbi:nucleic acid/nucleotide deaminase domain-containing protein, partial [Streptomyces lydicus]|uniref:nucleic acid/nucleotide deaminase domain-containing protein n=1 Tax=Streptomyces lydicus TaxID=47763 RepID=UPI0037AE7D4C
GHGSQAVIITQDHNGRAHAWNVVNHNGNLTYIDAQTGQRSNTPLHDGTNGVHAIPLNPNRHPLPSTTAAPSRDTANNRRPAAEPAGNGDGKKHKLSPDDMEIDEGAPQKHQKPNDYTPDHASDVDMPDADDPHHQTASESREARNDNLPQPETPDLKHSNRPPDTSQGLVREHESVGTPVHRIELHPENPADNPAYVHLNEWAKNGRLANLLEVSANRRAAYVDATKSVADARNALHDARAEHAKALKENDESPSEKNAQALADATAKYEQAQQDHADAREAVKDTDIPPTAFTEKELREILGPDFSRMNDGHRHVVIATVARMSLAFHANNSVGNSPERAPDGQSPYKGAARQQGKDREDPATEFDESVAAGRRANTASGKGKANLIPPKYREKGSTAYKAMQDLQRAKTGSDKANIAPRFATLLKDAKDNVPDFSEKNYAVVEVVDSDGNSTYIVDSSVPAQSDGATPRHSERHLLQWINRLNATKGAEGYTIAGLYTEREPCGTPKESPGHADCSQELRKALAEQKIPVYYSTTYREDTAGRAEAQQEKRAELEANRDKFIEENSHLSEADLKKQLKKEGLTDAQINSRVKETRSENETAMSAEMERHLHVVSELWAQTRISMLNRKQAGTSVEA